MPKKSMAHRSFNPALDPERVFQFRKEVEAIDRDRVYISLEVVKSQMEIPGHDPLRDREVVCLKDRPGIIIACSSLWPAKNTADAQMVVHPAHRRLGIGTELLKRLLDRGKKIGLHIYNGYAQHTNKGGNGFLLHHGFLEQGAYSELHSSLYAPPDSI